MSLKIIRVNIVLAYVYNILAVPFINYVYSSCFNYDLRLIHYINKLFDEPKYIKQYFLLLK
jgi:hypothetical protein